MKKSIQFLFCSSLMLGFNGNAGELPALLTQTESPSPKINGPSVFGVRPGSAFLYTIPATGDRHRVSNCPAANRAAFYRQSNNLISINWTGPGTLQYSPSLPAAVWTGLPTATSPYSFPAGNGQQFFRLSQ